MIDLQSPLFRLSGDIIIVCDVNGVITGANPSSYARLNLKPELTIGAPLSRLVREGQEQNLQQRLQASRSLTQTFPLDLCREDGSFLITHCSIEFDSKAQQYLIIATPFLNMPEEEHHRWRLALESTDAGFWGYDKESDTMYFSSKLEIMLGYAPGTIVPTVENLFGLIHPEDRAMALDKVTKFEADAETVPEASYRFEVRLVKKDGSHIWVLAMGARMTDKDGHRIANGWHIDINDRKLTEMKLRESEERSRTLLETLPDIIFVHDRNGVYREVHSNTAEQLLVPKNELIGRNISEFFSDKVYGPAIDAIRRAIDFGERTTFEYEIDLPSGHSYFEARFAPNYDGETALTIIRDVTENRVARLAKLESDELLRAFIENFPATVFNMKITPTGESYYTYVGGKATEEFEIDATEMLGRSLGDTRAPFIHPEDVESAASALSKSIALMSGLNWRGRFVLPSGKIRWSNTIGTPHLQRDGSVLFSAISIDVGQQRKLEQQVREQQALMTSSARLTSLGEMAGGIAHEINNPLTVAHAHAARLRDLANSSKDLDRVVIAKAAEKIEAVCMRISKIIAGLRSIARDGDSDRFSTVPLAPIVADALSLCSEKMRHRKIEFIVGKIPQTLSIECRSVQISQILVNLLLNAQHAVESQKGERWVKLEVVDAGAFVELRVSDSGVGVPEAVREKIFDPFFTTKEVGKGTGLGLSVSASIAHTHGGWLSIDDAQANTTFVLRLPKKQTV